MLKVNSTVELTLRIDFGLLNNTGINVLLWVAAFYLQLHLISCGVCIFVFLPLCASRRDGFFYLCRKPLQALNLKEDILIGCINRGGKIIAPKGGDTIEVGDTVIVVTTRTGLCELSDILQ